MHDGKKNEKKIEIETKTEIYKKNHGAIAVYCGLCVIVCVLLRYNCVIAMIENRRVEQSRVTAE